MKPTHDFAADQAAIQKFIAEQGIQKCPPGAAVLGESTPGWRRHAERAANVVGGGRAKRRQQAALEERKSPAEGGLPFVVCRYGPLLCFFRPPRHAEPAGKTVKRLQKLYGPIGGEFSLSRSSLKSKNINWSELVKILKNAKRASQPKLIKRSDVTRPHTDVAAWPRPIPKKARDPRLFVGDIHVSDSRFLTTGAWRELRYQTLVRYGARCQCCGATASDTVKIHVDHIKPRSEYPELALDPANVQVLCQDCNLGKSNRDITTWR